MSAMSRVEFYGASDDLVEVEGDFREEYNVYGDGPSTFVVGGLVRVYAIYGRGGTWAFGVGQVDEDVPIPADWKISLSQDPDTAYSVRLAIEAPVARLTVVEEKRREEDRR